MKIFKGFYVPFILLLLWSWGGIIGSINHYILPLPTNITLTALQLIQSGLLLKHLSISFYRVMIGFLLTFIVAFPLAVLLCMKRNMNDYFDPLLSFFVIYRQSPVFQC